MASISVAPSSNGGASFQVLSQVNTEINKPTAGMNFLAILKAAQKLPSQNLTPSIVSNHSSPPPTQVTGGNQLMFVTTLNGGNISSSNSPQNAARNAARKKTKPKK